jgi:hypothetical protein
MPTVELRMYNLITKEQKYTPSKQPREISFSSHSKSSEVQETGFYKD